MQINQKNYTSIWFDQQQQKVFVIDQRKLPFAYRALELKTHKDAFIAIKEMIVRGAPLIGITAVYGLYLFVKNNPHLNCDSALMDAGEYFKSARPTAVNLAYEVDAFTDKLMQTHPEGWIKKSLELAQYVEKKEFDAASKIGDYGLSLIEQIWKNKQTTINILTHCNAGWLAVGDWGTATAPIYKAHIKGIPIHVWVDETRPRNQGARLTAWELQKTGVAHTVIPDNTGGHLMQHGQVDLVIVGSDRTTRAGDVANKIGTYLKALAAHDNHIPFYVALPSSSIDFNIRDGLKKIPIEERSGEEIRKMNVLYKNKTVTAQLIPDNTPVANFGFDVTPAKYISGLITERGICKANENDILNLFPEQV